MKPVRYAEKDVLASVRKALKALGVFHLRVNTGRARFQGKTKIRYVDYGFPGMADLLAFPHFSNRPMPLWIETKGSDSSQTREQKMFQQIVEQEGHYYVCVRSAAELIEWLRNLQLTEPS
jgi:hypothetical protein